MMTGPKLPGNLPIPEPAIIIDEEGHARVSTKHHVENAIASLCIALQWCEGRGRSRNIIDALIYAISAKFDCDIGE